MDKIKFVRQYESWGMTWYEVCYKTYRIYTYTSHESLPKTDTSFINAHDGIAQYDKVFKRDEMIYQ